MSLPETMQVIEITRPGGPEVFETRHTPRANPGRR